MKISLKCLFFLLTIHFSSNGQKLLCQYSLVYKPDSTSNSSKQCNFFLITDGKNSLFRDKQAIKVDSLIEKYEKTPMNESNMTVFTNQMVQMPNPSFNYYLYKDILAKKIYYIDKIDKVNYYYTEPLDTVRWAITAQSKIIMGYKCAKAVASFGGRIWEAWFTREIPVPDGPYKFSGLPGLIIQANDTRNQYVFLLQSLSKTVPPILITPSTGNMTKTTNLALTKAKKDYQLSTPSRMAAKGAALSESTKQSFITRIQRQNNPIELK